ncbi:tyrosine-type recombinase/integrase, partial [Planctomycetota bacterium]
LKDHIAAFENWLKSSKARSGFHRNKKHIENTLARIRAIVDGCRFDGWQDITPAAVESFLGGLQIRNKTYNAYLTAFKFFCKWAVKNGRSEFSRIQYMDKLNTPNEEKHRALTAEEVVRLLSATVKAPERYGMTGLERAVLYRVAIETGFRAGELRHLTVGCFDLKKAIVMLDAKYCKDRLSASQFITIALASSLDDYFKGRESNGPAFNLGQWTRTAEMIQEDAIEAKIPVKDKSGLELVLHSTRHTLETTLSQARISQAVIDRIMRHKPQGIGQRIYTHVSPFEIRAAIEKLPAYPWPGDIQKAEKAKIS